MNGKSIYRIFLEEKMGMALGLEKRGNCYGSFKKLNYTKLRGFSPRANHTDTAAAAGRQS